MAEPLDAVPKKRKTMMPENRSGLGSYGVMLAVLTLVVGLLIGMAVGLLGLR